MKKELLSPAGSFAALKQAIHNGCDAVYLGGKKFGARKFASNFDEEEMVQAIRYCHLYGVKIYVTVNTIIYESEIAEALNYIRFLHQSKVDAVIMQDIGLITLVRQQFPNLEIHASTQLHTHNNNQIKQLEELGIKRVVVARELSLDEIQ
ncbi:MAG: U32 family peptidase, partial [bacterium]|nr:U32 family peptidase [bacterium]